MSRRTRVMIGGLVSTALLVGLAFLLSRTEPFQTLIARLRANDDGCVVYQKLDFDRHKGNFRPAGSTQLDLCDDSCGGKSLRIRRSSAGGDFGAWLPLHLEGVERLKIAYLCKARGVPHAMLNIWDTAAQDNITPKSYRGLSADCWSPVVYQVDAFRYNASSELDSGLKDTNRLQSIYFYGEQEGSTDTWMLLDNFAVYRGSDRTPPGRVQGVETSSTSEGVRLSWPPAADNVGVMRYVVARAEGPAGAFDRIAETAVPSWLDRVPGPGDYRYRVLACDFEENLGEWSDPVGLRVVPLDRE